MAEIRAAAQRSGITTTTTRTNVSSRGTASEIVVQKNAVGLSVEKGIYKVTYESIQQPRGLTGSNTPKAVYLDYVPSFNEINATYSKINSSDSESRSIGIDERLMQIEKHSIYLISLGRKTGIPIVEDSILAASIPTVILFVSTAIGAKQLGVAINRLVSYNDRVDAAKNAAFAADLKTDLKLLDFEAKTLLEIKTKESGLTESEIINGLSRSANTTLSIQNIAIIGAAGLGVLYYLKNRR